MRRYAYRLLICIALPLAVALLAWRGLRDRGYWRGFAQRFGFGPTVAGGALWVHAVSVGEVQTAAALVRALRTEYPDLPLVLTTVTPTGAARARALFADGIDVRFLPFDTTGSVRRFLTRVRPRVAIVIEKEVWPTLFHECGRQSIPLVLASAALAPRALARYRLLAPLFGATLAEGTVVAAQTAGDAERFRAIGAPAAATHVIGNLKFDLSMPATEVAAEASLRTRYGWQQRLVLVGGSTYQAEEEALLQVQRQLRGEGIELALLLAPRHPPRFAEVAARLQATGAPFARRSQPTAAAQAVPVDVLLLDSIGELPQAYAVADIAFVGGSLVPDIGGHNLLEPAALGVATLTGPHGYNAPDIAKDLQAAGGLGIVTDADTLCAEVRRLVLDAALRQRRGAAARDYVQRCRGALPRLLTLLRPLIRPASGSMPTQALPPTPASR